MTHFPLAKALATISAKSNPRRLITLKLLGVWNPLTWLQIKGFRIAGRGRGEGGGNFEKAKNKQSGFCTTFISAVGVPCMYFNVNKRASGLSCERLQLFYTPAAAPMPFPSAWCCCCCCWGFFCSIMLADESERRLVCAVRVKRAEIGYNNNKYIGK